MTRRRVINATCGQCGTPLLCGPDAPTAALDVKVDEAPLPDHRAELHAVLDGIGTYLLSSGELHHRDRWAITRPAADVHAAHRCDRAPLFLPAPVTRPPLPDTPPF